MGTPLRHMVTPHHVSRRLLTVAGIIAVAALIAVYYALPPDSGVYPRCMFRQLTGLDCPGCGSQRAIHALLHGDVAQAWHYNAMLIVGLPLVALIAAAHTLRGRWPALHRLLNSQTLILLILASIIGWTVIRNI